MIPQEIIQKKRDGKRLSTEEINFMVKGFVAEDIPDYQMSAWSMAVFFNDLDDQETADLLTAMIASGFRFDWSEYVGERTFVDKHSTGGVGDKTSLIVLPLLVAEGYDVPMVSGRGLGHTGGTLDKLESMPGMKTRLDRATFSRLIRDHHAAFGAQTDEFVPADSRLYSLRDVTATVESRSLITASIMSKKLAEGLDGLILDVKFGSGAFMRDIEKAERLARSLVGAGKKAGCRCLAALTSMEQPLGWAAGNSLEVVECLDILQGKNPAPDTRELSLSLAAALINQMQGISSCKALRVTTARLETHLTSGRAFEIFANLAVAQGAEVACVERRSCDWVSGGTRVVPVTLGNTAGTLEAVETRELGLALLELGGGRRNTDDIIRPTVGLTGFRKIGESVGVGEPLCYIHCIEGEDISHVIHRVRSAFRLTEVGVTVPNRPLIHSWIAGDDGLW